ncbi:MAG TPA: AP2 domain-containing protein [Calditrichia bacterium]|nr:hypothetical protein [Calditrichota bacterium]HQU73238.1 AP2 domain-containing protein [Calditrichia bacterium]HQV30738.1 AP2 domain-containing protein [Calditrichia bacterium]
MGNPFHTDYPSMSGGKEEGSLSPKLARHRPAYKGISRIDSEESHTHGWYVRIRRDGKVKSRFFSDRKYGGVAKALMKARRHYKQEMKRLIKDTLGEVPKKLPERVIVTRNRHNNTGVIGVQRVERENPGGSVYRAFRVCWTDDNGKARTRFFSINKMGEKEAFKQACQHRREKLLEK